MRVIILTSFTHGIASRVLPELQKNSAVEIAGVVLSLSTSTSKRRFLIRKTKKAVAIGIGGALNGLRLRKWYADPDSANVRDICKKLNVSLYETPRVSCSTTKLLFQELRADLGLSLGNSYIPRSVFSIPLHGMLNIHTELLPAFQGAHSIIWPIYENVKETGFSIHQVEKKIDAGEVLYQEKHEIVFYPTLRETVQNNLKTIWAAVPIAISHTCENYSYLKSNAEKQSSGRTYTTPSISQFLRMKRNHKRMYRESLQKE